jgi:uncharacterized protein YjdB
MNSPHFNILSRLAPATRSVANARRFLACTALGLALASATNGSAQTITASTQYSDSHLVFDNTQIQVGGAVFGNADTHDGIPFSLWSPPFTTPIALGEGVTVDGSSTWAGPVNSLGGDMQYNYVLYGAGNAATSLTFNGLDSSKKYLIQIGFCDKRVGSYPYNVTATLTLSDGTTGTASLAIGAAPTADDFALLSASVAGSTSLRLDLPTASNGVGPIVGGLSVHRYGPPAAPTGLEAVAGAGVVVLNWVATPEAGGYIVKRSTTSGAELEIGTASAATYTDHAVVSGTTYYYVVSATNSEGEGANSTEVSAMPTATKGNQTITFALGTELSKTMLDAPFADPATASSGLPVTYTSDNTSVATVDAASGLVTLVGAGTAQILANQAGDASFNPAPQAAQTLTVSRVEQTLTFTRGLMVSKHWSEASFEDPAMASSGLAVSYSSDNTGVATVDAASGLVTLVGQGTAQILADQAGDGRYNPAAQVAQTLTVGNLGATASNSTSHIVFENTGTLLGAAVFGNAGTYDGIAFSQWSPPFTAPYAMSDGVSVVGSPTWAGPTNSLGGDAQYNYVLYTAGNAPGSLTISGFDSNNKYVIQIGFCDKRVGSYPYSVDASVTLSDGTTGTTPLAIGAASTADDYALMTATVSGTTSLLVDLPTALNGVGAIVGGFSVHRFARPVAPAGLEAVAGAGVVVLNWTAAPEATVYNVKRSTTSGTEVLIGTTSATTYADHAVASGTPYYYVVSATNGEGEGENSTEVSATPTAAKGNQTITFALGLELSKTMLDAPFADLATASSGLPARYASDNTGVATVDADTGLVTLVGEGTARILADQAGDASFNPAPQAAQTLTVSKVDQTLTFARGLLLNKHWSEVPFEDPATASSGLPVSYSSDNTGVATVDANTGVVTLVGQGTAQILADQAGDERFNPAPQVAQALTVGNVGATTVSSASHIVFENTGTLLGGGVFGTAGTYDGIPFSLWSAPFTNPFAMSGGVSVLGSSSLDRTTGGLGGDGQYATATFSSSNAGGALTVTGLDSGKQYRFQVGFCDKRVGQYPYAVTATLTLSDSSTGTTPLAIGAVPTADDYALITVRASGTTSLQLDLPTATNGVGPIIAGFSVHEVTAGTDYDSWLSSDFGAPFTDTDPTHDPDHDGMTNWQEYAFGLNPTTGSSVNPLSQTNGLRSGTFSYTRRANSGLTYRVVYSSNLLLWTEDALALQTPATALDGIETVAVKLSAGVPLAGKLFIRMEAQ